MNGTLTAAALGGLILLFSLSAPLWARTDPDEAQLEAIRKEIDGDSAATDADKIRSFAEQFQAAPETLRARRAVRQGWGEVAIELVMARHLTRIAAASYPTMTEALDRIEALRAGNMGWGKIANYLGFSLGPVVSAAQQARNELRHGIAPEQPAVQKAGISTKSQTATRAERPAWPERVSRPERPSRPGRAARTH